MTGHEQFDCWQARVLPGVERVTGGVWSIPVPIPNNPLRYVNAYVLETPTGPVLVDPGWPATTSWDALEQGLTRTGFAMAEVVGVLVSHAHSDHHGLASRVRDASGCWVGMHEAEARELARLRDGSAVEERNCRWPDLCGIPDGERPSLRFDETLARRIGSLEPDLLIEPGPVGAVDGLEVEALWTPGHTPGHLCFRLPDSQVVLTGDHLLPRITAHVGTYRVDGPDVLGAYLDSLRDLDEWAADLDPEILPGHEYRFRGVSSRVQAALAHHAARLIEVVETVEELNQATAWSVAAHLTWSRSWTETTGNRRRLAVAETLTHLVHADALGHLTRLSGTPLRWKPSATTGRGDTP